MHLHTNRSLSHTRSIAIRISKILSIDCKLSHSATPPIKTDIPMCLFYILCFSQPLSARLYRSLRFTCLFQFGNRLGRASASLQFRSPSRYFAHWARPATCQISTMLHVSWDSQMIKRCRLDMKSPRHSSEDSWYPLPGVRSTMLYLAEIPREAENSRLDMKKAQQMLRYALSASGRCAMAILRPLGAARAKPSQVLCCTLTGIAG